MKNRDNSFLFEYDSKKRLKYPALCGVDEAGRGPLCGPLCVAAVVLPPSFQIEGIDDSKKLSEKSREALFDTIINNALSYKIVFIEPKEIDALNIHNATLEGMKQSVEGLEIKPDYALFDGAYCPRGLEIGCEAVKKGDSVSASIAAASILAKVSRDRLMLELDKKNPEYMLAKHKGYPTKLHYQLLDKYGVKDFYRRSFLVKRGYVDEI